MIKLNVKFFFLKNKLLKYKLCLMIITIIITIVPMMVPFV